MRASLRDRWFPDLAREEQEEKDTALQKLDELKNLVSHGGYKEHIRDWLDMAIVTHRPKPGAEGSMNYSIGVSDGLQIVKEHITLLEREARREHD